MSCEGRDPWNLDFSWMHLEETITHRPSSRLASWLPRRSALWIVLPEHSIEGQVRSLLTLHMVANSRGPRYFFPLEYPLGVVIQWHMGIHTSIKEVIQIHHMDFQTLIDSPYRGDGRIRVAIEAQKKKKQILSPLDLSRLELWLCDIGGLFAKHMPRCQYFSTFSSLTWIPSLLPSSSFLLLCILRTAGSLRCHGAMSIAQPPAAYTRRNCGRAERS